MKNKKRLKIGILFVVILVSVIGIIGVKKMNEPTTKEKQIAFLQAHEEEMAEYVKMQNEKVAKVVFDWDSFKQESVGNGLLQGVGNIFIIRIQIIDKDNKEINSFGFAIEPDSVREPKNIEKMYTINANYNYYKEG